MKIGTKSLLYGAHQFAIHPWFVAWAWWRLYGFPWDPRLWVTFFVHDLGYWGKPNMDGPEGESHIWAGAKIVGWLFDVDRIWDANWHGTTIGRLCAWIWGATPHAANWYSLCYYHSRFVCKQYGVPISKLGVADKLSIVLTPAWVYLPLVRLTGEWREYVAAARAEGKYADMNLDDRHGLLPWFRSVQVYLRNWVGVQTGRLSD